MSEMKKAHKKLRQMGKIDAELGRPSHSYLNHIVPNPFTRWDNVAIKAYEDGYNSIKRKG